ncbi:hypothetical protein PILCRDRAFT_32726, partial [Piloderma croceum F 1598]
KPPVVTPGKLTPYLLFDFENGAFSYFSFKEVRPEREVSKVAGSLQDGCVQTWYCLNHTAIDGAGFNAFVASVRSQWLDPGWEQEIKLIILSSNQGSMPISNWIMLVKSTNALLKGHVCELSEADLHNHISSHDCCYYCQNSSDDARVCANELLKAVVKQMLNQLIGTTHHNAPNLSLASSVRCGCTQVSSTPTAAGVLYTACVSMASERALLVEHDICFKCHTFYTTHKSSDCPNGFPNRSLYVPLT